MKIDKSDKIGFEFTHVMSTWARETLLVTAIEELLTEVSAGSRIGLCIKPVMTILMEAVRLQGIRWRSRNHVRFVLYVSNRHPEAEVVDKLMNHLQIGQHHFQRSANKQGVMLGIAFAAAYNLIKTNPGAFTLENMRLDMEAYHAYALARRFTRLIERV
jgi:hypothetical protein